MIRRPHAIIAAGICAGTLAHGSRAAAACEVDSFDTTIHERRGKRTDRIRLFVDSGLPDCTWLKLSAPGSGAVVDVRARVLRGDTRNVRFGSETMVRAEDGSTPGTWLALPGLRTGDIVSLRVERNIEDSHTWDPTIWGVPGWTRLHWKGSAIPTAATIQGEGGRFFAERTALVAAGGEASVQYGEPASTPETTRHTGTARLKITLQPEASPPPGEPPTGSTRVAWSVPVDHHGQRALAWPSGATQRICQVEGSSEALVEPTEWGCVVTEADPEARLYAAWTVPRLQLAGEVGPRSRAPLQASIPWHGHAHKGPPASSGTRAEVGAISLEVEGVGVSFRGQVLSADRESARAGEGRLQLLVPGTTATDPDGLAPHAGWWVTAVHGQPLLADRAALVSAVARSAIQASVPEPGLPSRIRLRAGEVEMIPVIQDLVRDQIRPDTSRSTRSLQPRKLLQARRSTWGTEWEIALITARYLRQLKLDAVPVPVRPTGVVPADGGMPTGFDHAVVQVQIAGDNPSVPETLWLDPACAVCAPGELRPFLWGADALAAPLSSLPSAPAGEQIEVVEVTAGGTETVEVQLRGTAALQLRLELLAIPASERVAALDARFRGHVTHHEGLADPGSPIRIQLTRTGVLTPEPPSSRIPSPSASHIRVPWIGPRVHELRLAADVHDVSLPPAGQVSVDGTGVSWKRTLRVEADGTRVARDVLTLARPVVSRDSLQALREQLPTRPAVLLDVPGDAPPAEAGAPGSTEASP